MSAQPTEQAVREIEVVIADDEPRARAALKALLNAVTVDPSGSNRLRVTVVGEAANGQEAVNLATKRRPQVVLMDLHMPVMDGLQATRAIKSQQPDVRVVVQTAYGTQRRSALAAGADAILLKGCPTNELLAAILDGLDPRPATG